MISRLDAGSQSRVPHLVAKNVLQGGLELVGIAAAEAIALHRGDVGVDVL